MSGTRDFSGLRTQTQTQTPMRSRDGANVKRDTTWSQKPVKTQGPVTSNFMSETAYPSLGSRSAAPPKPKPALNFKKTVEEMAARSAEEVLARQVLARQVLARQVIPRQAAVGTAVKKPVQFSRYRNTDDVPEDYDGPDEDEEEEEEEEDTYEYVTRRGDKGIW